MQTVDFSPYLFIVQRRKWWFILPFLLTLLGGLTAVLIIPRVYEAKTLVLVQRQKVPEHYVQEIVSTDLPGRLKMISQQVVSRTNLEQIIKDHHLYSNPGRKNITLEEKIRGLRNRIKIVIAKGDRRGSTGNSFTVSFRDKTPRKAMEITNALASNFISENLKIRETQAVGTSVFLADELMSVKKRLAAKEEILKSYRKKHMGSMPENLENNLRMLSRYQEEMEDLNENLRDAENRKLIIQDQIVAAEKVERKIAAADAEGSLVSDGVGPESRKNDLPSLRRKLKFLETRYTHEHPDLIKLKAVIAGLETAPAESESETTTSVSRTGKEKTGSAGSDLLKNQLAEIKTDIANTKAEIENARNRRSLYQKRVEQTPEREQELISLRRDYGNLKSLYDSLLDRKLEAEISVNLEKKQKGEQFRIIDPAKIPELPVEPDVRKILLMTLLLGLGLGAGLAYLQEMMDSSYKNPEEAKEELQIPVLVSIPLRQTRNELRRRKRKQILSFASVGAGFVISAAAIVISIKGMDSTVHFVKEILAGESILSFLK